MSTASPQSPQSEQKLLFCLLTPQLRNAGGGQLKPTHGCEAPPLLLKASVSPSWRSCPHAPICYAYMTFL